MSTVPTATHQSVVVNIESDSDSDEVVFESDCKIRNASNVCNSFDGSNCDNNTTVHRSVEKDDRSRDKVELKLIEGIIDQANEVFIQNNGCKFVHGTANCNNKKELAATYEKYVTSKIDIYDYKTIYIPFYIDSTDNSKVEWVELNGNNNLQNKLKRSQKKFLVSTNPAMWVCEEFDESLQARKELWMKQVNEMKDLKPTQMFISSTSMRTFVLMEYSYYIHPKKQVKCLCGLCLFLCELDEENKFQIVDIANIKLSNSPNRVYGNIIKFIDKYRMYPVFVYVPQTFNVSVLFNTYLFPWSYFLVTHGKIFNLITMVHLESDSVEGLASRCIDSDRHTTSCVLCNGLQLFYNLGSNNFRTRPVFETLNKTLVHDDLRNHCLLPMYKTCKHCKYMTYSRNTKNILNVECDCTMNN